MHAFMRTGLMLPAATGTPAMGPCPPPAHTWGRADDDGSAPATDDYGTLA